MLRLAGRPTTLNSLPVHIYLVVLDVDRRCYVSVPDYEDPSKLITRTFFHCSGDIVVCFDVFEADVINNRVRNELFILAVHYWRL